MHRSVDVDGSFDMATADANALVTVRVSGAATAGPSVRRRGVGCPAQFPGAGRTPSGRRGGTRPVVPLRRCGLPRSSICLQAWRNA